MFFQVKPPVPCPWVLNMLGCMGSAILNVVSEITGILNCWRIEEEDFCAFIPSNNWIFLPPVHRLKLRVEGRKYIKDMTIYCECLPFSYSSYLPPPFRNKKGFFILSFLRGIVIVVHPPRKAKQWGLTLFLLGSDSDMILFCETFSFSKSWFL